MKITSLVLFTLLATQVACNRGKNATGANRAAAAASASTSLTLGAYTTPREAYGKAIIPRFRKDWQTRGNGNVEFRESYLGSSAQARAIAGGFEADIAALSLEPDIEELRKAGLITHAWNAGPHHGVVAQSVVVIGVRAGNPKGIRDWEDLARPGIEVLTPNVRTSGGAMWNVLAVYGAALRGHAGAANAGPDGALKLLARVLRNVKIMDRGARDSMLTFERGVGDAIITYENEILVGRAKGQRYDFVTPPSTILIENPVALVDTYVDRHQTRAVAEAFVTYLWTTEAQRAYAENGLRPVDPTVAAEVGAKFPPVQHLFTVRDLGNWAGVQAAVFAQGGAYDQALEQSRNTGL